MWINVLSGVRFNLLFSKPYHGLVYAVYAKVLLLFSSSLLWQVIVSEI